MTHLLTITAFVCFFAAVIGLVCWLGWLTNNVLALREQEWEFELSLPLDDDDFEDVDEEFDIYSSLVDNELDLLLPDDEDRHL